MSDFIKWALAALVTAWVALAPTTCALAAGTAEPPALEAGAASLVDVASGRILFQKDAGLRLPPASTAKILTALVVLERAPLRELITVSRTAASAEGSSMYLQPDMTLTVEDLLYGLLLESGNDAALALAEGVAGSVEGFAGLMNERARAAGATDSNFVNPSGLPAAGQYTTARDLGLIARAALLDPTLSRIVATRDRKLTLPGGQVRHLTNHNWLLGGDGIDGVKTGYTTEAGHTYVASASRGGWRLVAAVLRDTKEGKWRDARKLLDFGFTAYRPVRLVEDGVPLGTVPLAGGRSGAVPLVLRSRAPVMVPLSADGSESAYVRVEAPGQLHPPIKAGQTVGRLKVIVNSRPLYTIPLQAGRGVTERADHGATAERHPTTTPIGTLGDLAEAFGRLWHAIGGGG